ncbi:hypothetical protein FISHEDRAFT_71045 [Fistulina hepatica ATCC 64428]|nr:hypothetical protein FISHEDRAFT_71045 [Fistulina hepatica ATCC 64428]
MAGRIARLPRLTLFAGNQCSLCAGAKHELAKVRSVLPFELTQINIHEEGQERWRKKYMYWIPVLHIDGKEVLKGRWDSWGVLAALENWKAQVTSSENSDTPKP